MGFGPSSLSHLEKMPSLELLDTKSLGTRPGISISPGSPGDSYALLRTAQEAGTVSGTQKGLTTYPGKE